MWFQNAEWGVYWLTNSKVRTLKEYAPLLPAPDSAPIREVELGDRAWDNYVFRSVDKFQTVHWIINPNWEETVGVKVISKVPFPINPTVTSLEAWYKKAGSDKSKGLVYLDKDITIIRREVNNIVLSIEGRHVACFYAPNFVQFYCTLPIKQIQIDGLIKYLTGDVKIEMKDDIVGVRIKQGWVPLFNHLTINLGAGTCEGKELTWITKEVETYQRLKRRVSDYVATITPESLMSAAGELLPTKHAIITRCNGCQAFDSTHLNVHLDRKDIDLFLIYSAYESFGKDMLGGPARLTWDLIEKVQHDEDVSDVREIVSNFFLYYLRSPNLTFTPLPSKIAAKQEFWRHGNWKQFRIEEDRPILVPTEEVERARPGELIANERRDQVEAQHVFRQRLQREQRRVGENAANINRLIVAARDRIEGRIIFDPHPIPPNLQGDPVVPLEWAPPEWAAQNVARNDIAAEINVQRREEVLEDFGLGEFLEPEDV